MKKILIFILFLFLPLFFVKAADPLQISLNKERFSSGDNIILKTEFINLYNTRIKGILSCGLLSPDPEFPPMPSMMEIDLEPGEKTETLECEMTFSDGMPEGIYKGWAEVIDENKTTVIKKEKEFIVEGLKKQIKAELLLCGDSECSKRKVVFVKGEKIYVKLNASVYDPIIKSDIDGEEIFFDNNTAIISAEEEGSFVINISLKKEGFNEEILSKDFAVINSPAKIESSSVCKVDAKCSGDETLQNCPQDCTFLGPSVFDLKNIFLFVVLVIAFGLIFWGYRIIKKNDV